MNLEKKEAYFFLNCSAHFKILNSAHEDKITTLLIQGSTFFYMNIQIFIC